METKENTEVHIRNHLWLLNQMRKLREPPHKQQFVAVLRLKK